jgi:hypothetical protein
LFFAIVAIALLVLGPACEDCVATPPTLINVEVDYMYAPDHIHRLYQNEIDAVVAMFGCQGITLNVEISDSIPELEVIDGLGGGFHELKDMYCNHLTEPGWHYCIMAHNYELGGVVAGSTGYAEIYGSNFIVTLGQWLDQVGEPFDRAGSFAHELGHNLGLTHAGSQNEYEVSAYKPNYASIMTYRYQIRGVGMAMSCWLVAGTNCHTNPFKNLDYSHGTLPPLNEAALNERLGIGYGPVDWNCNGVIDAAPVAHELGANYNVGNMRDWCPATGDAQVLTDYDDWSNIVDVTWSSALAATHKMSTIACITYDEAYGAKSAEAWPPACWNDKPAVTIEPCAFTFADQDADHVYDSCDNCVSVANNDQADPDGDLIGSACDNCPGVANPGQEDANHNGIGDACECACDCPADPANCDHVQNVLDVVQTINVAFRGQAAIPDPNVRCPFQTTDVDCSQDTGVLDVVRVINVAFRGANMTTEFCDPCP